ncbi:phage tail protein [Puniceibacterium sediminis]|uniref:Microcystin-dependent protein n=1 Tax=Puniceibacterium sediminis TaxID=1608407 RepID=A0A238WBZ8_9RHOB|nr:tail fiber protein [Puniceibacterium sediminis]SNR43937.1 Microcystin-dependent protein [Puniceibacterium sediminis]
MSEPFIGEIRMFAGNFAPVGWAFCDGQLLAVSQNDALFSLIGTIYGGDGRTTFGLPDMRGRVPLHFGDGPGLSSRRLGSKAGTEHVTLTMNELPIHGHDFHAQTKEATAAGPEGNVAAMGVGVNFYSETAQDTNMAQSMLSHTGGSRQHTNLMPTLCVHFIIALFGIYPSRQ